MSEPFDPYHKWLAIPAKDQPPHHYRLLGLDVFEGDADVIENAADQRMSHIRTMATGKNGPLSQRVLNEISAARIVLLNPQKKSQYDAQLRQTLTPAAANEPAQAAPGPTALTPILPNIAAPLRPLPLSPIAVSIAVPRAPVRRPVASRWVGPVVGGAAAAAVIVAVIVVLSSSGRTTRPPSDSHTSQGPAENPPETKAAPPQSTPAVKQESPPPTELKPAPTPAIPASAAAPSTIAGVDAIAERNITEAVGLLTDKFALCQTMPLAIFIDTADRLGKAGYRPIRARPYLVRGDVLIAGVWWRDEHPWKFEHGLLPAEIAETDHRYRQQGYVPVDVAGCATERGFCLALWAQTGEDVAKFEMYAAVPHAEHGAKYDEVKGRGFRPLLRHSFFGVDGQQHHSMIWNKHGRAYYIANGTQDYYYHLMKPDRFQIDTGLSQWRQDGAMVPLYSAVFEVTTKRQSQQSHGLPPAEHLEECREIAKSGRRPVAIAVIYISDDRPWATASVWH